MWSRWRQTFPPELAFAWLAVLMAITLNAVWLAPELSIARLDLNDNVLHYTLIERAADALERGENPVDHWVSEWTLGYPVPRTYQPLGHAFVACLHRALGKSVALMTLFTWTRYLLLVLFPLTIFASALLLRLRPAHAAAAAIVAPLISTDGLYGLEFGSYVWRGSGLYTQSWAMHLLPLTLGLAFRAVERGRGLAISGVLLGLTFLSHFVYGYIGALSIVLLGIIFRWRVEPLRAAFRVLFIGAAAFALTAFQVLPLWKDSPFINHSRWEAAWKWDSHGLAAVLGQLFTGGLLDAGRLPVLTLLAVVGTVVCVWRLRSREHETENQDPPTPSAAYLFLITGALLWLALYCGRPVWGPLFTLLGASHDMHLHRLIGGAHTFLIFLSGVALGGLWTSLARSQLRGRYVAAAVLTALVLWPAWRERSEYLAQGAQWGRDNLAAYESEQHDLRQVIAATGHGPDRVFAGLAAGWGGEFRIGSVPFYAFLSTNHTPAVAFLYHSMALTSDIMVRFNEWDWSHYRLFNVGAVVAEEGRPLAPFLEPLAQAGRFRVLRAPSGGYFELVSVPYAVRTSKTNFYDVNDPWLQSGWAAYRQHLLLDFEENTPAGMERLYSTATLPPVGPAAHLGLVEQEKRDGEIYQATVNATQDCFLLFKMTYHPNWRVFVDGEQKPASMLSPGFAGVPLRPGRHSVEWRYQPEGWKTPLMAFGLLGCALLIVIERRGALRRVEDQSAERLRQTWNRLPAERRRRWLTAFGLAALSLPAATPLFTSDQLLGHDALAYLPRLVEFHENVRQGILLPRWAPDLSSGFGQPLFLFNPPMIYALGEAGLLAGMSPVAALNAACAAIILASAVSMFLLGRLLFGAGGGWLAAAAYLYAPYFHVNLFVRQALAEFAAFPFYPLALYGFAAHARKRDPRYLVLAALGYAGVIYAHHAAALMFSPLLAAFVVFQARKARSWRLLLSQTGGMLLGLGLGAAIWLPSLLERQYVQLGELLEDYLRYTNHFVYPQQFVLPNWGYGLSTAGYDDGMSFSLGWGHLALAAAALFAARKKRSLRDQRLAVFFALAAAAYCAVMMPGSLWLWDHLALLQYLQFPWRLLGPAGVCVALLVASLASADAAQHHATRNPSRRWPLIACLALLVIPNLAHVAPAGYATVDLALWTPEQIARRGVATTTREEYQPRWVQLPPFRAEPIVVVAGSAEVGVVDAAATHTQSRVTALTASVVEFRCSYFPGWQALLDGRETPIEIAEPSGLIRVRVPPGEHSIELRFRRTTPRWLGDGSSLLSAAVLVWFVTRRRSVKSILTQDTK